MPPAGSTAPAANSKMAARRLTFSMNEIS